MKFLCGKKKIGCKNVICDSLHDLLAHYIDKHLGRNSNIKYPILQKMLEITNRIKI